MAHMGFHYDAAFHLPKGGYAHCWSTCPYLSQTRLIPTFSQPLLKPGFPKVSQVSPKLMWLMWVCAKIRVSEKSCNKGLALVGPRRGAFKLLLRFWHILSHAHVAVLGQSAACREAPLFSYRVEYAVDRTL